MSNYLVEANLSLVLFFTAYALLIRKETDFSIQRLFLLAGIIGSLTFPLIHISYYQPRIPSLSELLPTYLLPELTIGSHERRSGPQSLQYPFNIWHLVQLVYVAGLLFFLARFVLQLLQLTRKMNASISYRVGECNVVESADSKHTFSFSTLYFWVNRTP